MTMDGKVIQGSYRVEERGFALVSSLMFLVVLTIFAVSSMGTNALEEKMLGFSRDRQIALQAADAALRDAERYMLLGAISGATGFAAGCSSGAGLYQVQTSGTPIWIALSPMHPARMMRGLGSRQRSMLPMGNHSSTARSLVPQNSS